MFLPEVRTFCWVPPLLGFLILIGLAVISFLKGRRKAINLHFSAICLLGALLNGNFSLVSLIPSPENALFIYRLTYCFFVFTLPLYIRFIHSFLAIRGRRLIEKCAWGGSLLFLSFLPTDLFFKGFYEYDFGRIAHGGPIFFLFAVTAVSSVVYCLAVLVQGLKRAHDNQQKNRIRYIAGGLGLGALLMSFNVFPVMGFHVYPLGNFNFIPAIILAFGVLKYDLLDMGVLIRRGLVYFVLTGILAAIYITVIYATSYLLMESGYRNPLLALVLSGIIVFLFDPLKRMIRSFLDRTFFMGRYDYRAILKEISGGLNRMHRFEEIRQCLLHSIVNHIGLKSVYLIVRSEINGEVRYYEYGERASSLSGKEAARTLLMLGPFLQGFPAAASRSALARVLPSSGEGEIVLRDMDSRGVVAVVPMKTKDRLMGVLLLGEKESGELFVHEDLEILVTMANQAVTALENALFLERLEEANRELEARVASRTADLRKALEEKERTEALLIRSESLAAVGQLVAGAAHELNNPLAGASSLLQSSVELLQRQTWDESRKPELIEDLLFSLKELKRAGAIVRSLLGLSRQSDDYFEPVRIKDLMEDALRVLQNPGRQMPVNIIREFENDVPDVEGNFAALGQVLVNIVKNALQSLSEEGGTIILGASYDQAGDMITITCRDDGRGIPPSKLQDIFKPFYTTKVVGEGTGLGLYIAYELVKRHDGVIHVESKEGAGSVFKVLLPRKRRMP